MICPRSRFGRSSTSGTGGHTLSLRPGAAGLLAAVVAALFAAGSARAQAPGMPWRLAFKFKPGQVQHFRSVAKTDVSLSPEGQGGGLGPIPINATTVMLAFEKVVSVEGGNGKLTAGVPSMTLTTGAFGMSIVVKTINGKTEVLMNGQAMPGAAGLGGMLGGVPGDVSLVRTPLGATLEGEAGGFAGAPAGILTLPEAAVKIGETWEVQRKLALSLPRVGPAAAVPAIDATIRHTLKSVDKVGGRSVATIEVATIEAPPPVPAPAAPQGGDMPPPFRQKMNGIFKFDIDRGVVLSSTVKLELSGTFDPSAAAAAAGAAGGAAPGGAGGGQPGGGLGGLLGSGPMKIDGYTETTVTEVPAPKPPGPAAKKPSTVPTKKPTRKP